ncbi:ABC transporter substrate-binding protein [Paenibacillus sp. LHD-117]|uniref:ABC transporter substrate-binding protein n=1 Tax=Paenibacillus sp. LHD-117 TaxID=3071412 RepID=UPI0027E0F9E8|nr:ABC transporter substrate-binding protein [Paenibacillus sp. LHD-117]MDQ6420178.1 ABC transporter substrate-binding protein [Paenibacillus sp. LHD-117]
MKKTNRWLSSSLAIAMSLVLFLSACSNGGNDEKATNTSTPQASETAAPGAPDTKDPYEIELAILSFTGVPKDMQMVQDEINKITQSKINATVKITAIPVGNWAQQTNLMLNSNARLDMLITSGTLGYSVQAAKGQLYPLDKLLDQYGQDIKAVLEPQVLNGTKINGEIFGVPTIRDHAASYGFVMRKDLVDKYGIDVGAIKTYEDLEKVLKTIKDNEPAITPVVDNDVLLRTPNVDSLGGDSLGVLMNMDNLKVENYYESQEYANHLKMTRKWYQEGYILKDAATNQTSPDKLVQSGNGFGFFNVMKPGYAAQVSRTTGMEMVTAEIIPPTSTTANITGLMWSIYKNSKNPERTMMFLNLLYSDADLINLFNWGIEGKHYVKQSDGLIDFAPGVDAASTGYNPNWDYMTGNQFLSHIFKGNDPDIWNKLKTFNKEALKSKALGFSFDAESVKTEFTALNNVLGQYQKGLGTGTLDPEKNLPDFISKLKAAGIDKVIAEKQKQLDEWAKVNNVQ